MGTSEWIAFGALLFTIAMGGGGVIAALFSNKGAILAKMESNKGELEEELNAIRLSAYEEYKTLRQEIQAIRDTARTEFGETISAIREKVVQIEIWTRDRIDRQRVELSEEIDKLDHRTRQVEMFMAREMGRREGA